MNMWKSEPLYFESVAGFLKGIILPSLGITFYFSIIWIILIFPLFSLTISDSCFTSI